MKKLIIRFVFGIPIKRVFYWDSAFKDPIIGFCIGSPIEGPYIKESVSGFLFQDSVTRFSYESPM